MEHRACFPNLSKHFAYRVQIEYAGPLNIDKMAYHRKAQPQLRASLHIFLQVIDINYATFDKTHSIFSKFIKTFRLPDPDLICWPSQLGQNRLPLRRSTSATLQLHASLHIFLQRIWHKLWNISIELTEYFPNFSRHFAYQAQIEIAASLNLDKISYNRSAQPQRRCSSGLVCTYFSNVSDTNYATFR